MLSHPTLLDVARAAGVSRSTASRALSDAKAVSPTARQRVQEAASTLGYRGNHAARSLRTKRSLLVGLVINNLVNSAFRVIVEVVQRQLDQEGYQILLCVTNADTDAEARYLRMLGEQQVDGVLIIGTGNNTSEIAALQRMGIPVVRLIRTPHKMDSDTVLADDEQGAYQAVSYLLRLNHVDIACVVGPQKSTSAEERLLGYRRAMSEARLPINETHIFRGPYELETGFRAIRYFMALKTAPTAIYVGNHEAALGALPALSDWGVSLPSQLSIVCHEDAPWFRYWSPPITVVDHMPKALAELAASRLLAQISAPSLIGQSKRIFRTSSRIIIRNSAVGLV